MSDENLTPEQAGGLRLLNVRLSRIGQLATQWHKLGEDEQETWLQIYREHIKIAAEERAAQAPRIDVEALADVLLDAYEKARRLAGIVDSFHHVARAAANHLGDQPAKPEADEVAKLRADLAMWKGCAMDADGRGRKMARDLADAKLSAKNWQASYDKACCERDELRKRAENAEQERVQPSGAKT